MIVGSVSKFILQLHYIFINPFRQIEYNQKLIDLTSSFAGLSAKVSCAMI